MARLSEEKKWQIISLWKLHKSIRQVATAAGVSVNSAQKWISRYKVTQGVASLKPTGRRKIISEAAAAVAYNVLLEQEGAHADFVANELVRRGLVATKPHKATVIKAATQHGERINKPIKCVLGKPRKQLRDDTKVKRLAFAAQHRRQSWKAVMFTDRKKFEFKYPGARVHRHKWITCSDRYEANTVNHAQSVNLYAGITPYGMTASHIVAGTSQHKTPYKTKKGIAARSITSQEYADVLTHTLLPEGRRLFSGHCSSWTLQQDKDPCHNQASTIIKDWSKAKGCSITLLPSWPGNSPDLNLIENIWSYVERKVDALGCKTFPEFKAAVLLQIKNVPQRVIRNLYRSMAQRITHVWETKGEKTKY